MCAAGRVRQSFKQTSIWFGLVCLGYFSSLPLPHSVPWLWGWLGLDWRHQKTHLSHLPFPVPMATDNTEEWMLQMFLGPKCLFLRSRGEKVQVCELIKHHPRKDAKCTTAEYSKPLSENVTSCSCLPKPFQNLGMRNDNGKTLEGLWVDVFLSTSNFVLEGRHRVGVALSIKIPSHLPP